MARLQRAGINNGDWRPGAPPACGGLCPRLLYVTPSASTVNPNTLSLPFWALTVLLFWRAINSGHLRNWLLCGIAGGLGLLVKYAMVFLLLPLILYLLCSQYRRLLGQPGPYVAAATSVALFLPHLMWVFQNRFVTVNYAWARASPRQGMTGHVLFPLRFVFQEISLLIFILLLAALLVPWRSWNRRAPVPRRSGKSFLFVAAAGPFLTLLALSMLFGFNIQRPWGTPLWSFTGVFLVQILGGEFSSKILRRFACGWICFQVLLATSTVVYLQRHSLLKTRPTSRFYPGPMVTASVYANWYKFCNAPPPIVAGTRPAAENVGFFGVNRPVVYVDLDPEMSPWTNDEDLTKRGGVIVVENRDFPEEWLKRFPSAQIQPAVETTWLGHPEQRLKITMAFVPSSQQGKR